jgi:ABC-2 type transport system permease protein
MKTLLAHIKFQFIKSLRNPGFWVPTVLFPAMLYSFFGSSLPPQGIYSQIAIASFCVYAVLGVSFYQFGVGIAQDRESLFDGWLKTLPNVSIPSGLAQIIVAIFFSIIAVTLVLIASLFLGKTPLEGQMLVKLILVCILIGVPASMMGIALGYFASGRAAPALANLIFLPLAFLGGLWIPPIQMPQSVNNISIWSPTRQMGEFSWSAITGQMPDTRVIILFIAYSLLFGMLAILLIARDKRKRFG